MDIARQIDRIDRTRWQKGHNGTVYTQSLFGQLEADEIGPDALAYPPCWAALDPGMTLEPHAHPIHEFYVFVSGEGRMQLGDEWFDVRAGTAVNIPPNVVHSAANDASAPGPLVWVSVGLKS